MHIQCSIVQNRKGVRAHRGVRLTPLGRRHRALVGGGLPLKRLRFAQLGEVAQRRPLSLHELGNTLVRRAGGRRVEDVVGALLKGVLHQDAEGRPPVRVRVRVRANPGRGLCRRVLGLLASGRGPELRKACIHRPLEALGAPLAVEEAEQRARQGLQAGVGAAILVRAVGAVDALSVLDVLLNDLPAVTRRVGLPEDGAVGVGKAQPGHLVGAAADHHAMQRVTGVVARQLRRGGVAPQDAAVQREPQLGEVPRQREDELVLELWDLAVLGRRQPIEQRAPRVDDEVSHRGASGDGLDELHKLVVGAAVVHADAALHRDGRPCRRRLAHLRTDVRHALRLVHERGAEAALARDLVARAAAVEVDFVVAPPLSDGRRRRQLLRVAPAQLQHDGMLRNIVAQVPLEAHVRRQLVHGVRGGVLAHLAIHVHQRGVDHHLGVQPGVPRQQPTQVAKVRVRPVHHRRHTQPRRLEGGVLPLRRLRLRAGLTLCSSLARRARCSEAAMLLVAGVPPTHPVRGPAPCRRRASA
eukprot:scaffold1261_cov377-Prasinococcus_capsulatus_cf.AAC.16